MSSDTRKKETHAESNAKVLAATILSDWSPNKNASSPLPILKKVASNPHRKKGHQIG